MNPTRADINELIAQAADINLYMYTDLNDRIHVIQPNSEYHYQFGTAEFRINGHEVDQTTMQLFLEWLNNQ